MQLSWLTETLLLNVIADKFGCFRQTLQNMILDNVYAPNVDDDGFSIDFFSQLPKFSLIFVGDFISFVTPLNLPLSASLQVTSKHFF